jgi:nitroreductase
MILDLSIDELLTTTRTVRKRLDLERPVERGVIEECLELALQAPNGSNHQQWRWIVLDEPETIQRAAAIYVSAMEQYTADIAAGREQYLRGGSRAAQIGASVAHLKANLHRVPALLIPTLADRFGVHRKRSGETFHEASQWGSILPAVWSFMLALRSRGLGSAWTTIHLLREHEMAELLGIPYEANVQAGLFPIAYTIGTEFRRAARQPVSEVLSYNAW